MQLANADLLGAVTPVGAMRILAAQLDIGQHRRLIAALLADHAATLAGEADPFGREYDCNDLLTVLEAADRELGRLARKAKAEQPRKGTHVCQDPAYGPCPRPECGVPWR